MQPKRVAIIGAGPSGLVTAKTLLHNSVQGAFIPTIFDASHEVGGLWPSPAHVGRLRTGDGLPGIIDPYMRTNLSRFTVAFSDLSWETVLGEKELLVFPQAWQVGQYLSVYARTFISDKHLRLGHRVVRTVRTTEDGTGAQWRVFWTKQSSSPEETIPGPVTSSETFFEDFDLLVVASGYFSRPYFPQVPGLKDCSAVLHSSDIQGGHGLVEKGKDLGQGNVVVIGGSMSGVEAASTVALHQSSTWVAGDMDPQTPKSQKVYHIHSRPFWNIPTYIPHEVEEKIAFLPLDLAMYDLGRRPPGPIDYAVGPIPKDKVAKSNQYFKSLLGPEYEKFGHLGQPSSDASVALPPWVAIGNDYADFIRSGGIETTMGRAVSVVSQDETGLSTVNIETSDGHSESLKDVTTVIMATGFTPFEALSFLPDDVLAKLEYTSEDSILPLILDKGGTIRSEIPDIGFCGFYRGPYWGVMEMQARFLANVWSSSNMGASDTGHEMHSLRKLREPGALKARGQFPMGDYVGLMESFAKDLGIARTEISADNTRSGPVIPARYHTPHPTTPRLSHLQSVMKEEVQKTLSALGTISHADNQASKAARTSAIFRALQGTWKSYQILENGDQERSGCLHFYPRSPSNPGYEREYVCEEIDGQSTKKSYLFRLVASGADNAPPSIEIWTTKSDPGRVPDELYHALELGSFNFRMDNGRRVSGEYVISSNVQKTPVHEPRKTEVESKHQYTFNLQAVSIVSWERIDLCGESRNLFVFKR